ncbi:unnamed protein product, partial [Rotaria sp. Silwood1]
YISDDDDDDVCDNMSSILRA